MGYPRKVTLVPILANLYFGGDFQVIVFIYWNPVEIKHFTMQEPNLFCVV